MIIKIKMSSTISRFSLVPRADAAGCVPRVRPTPVPGSKNPAYYQVFFLQLITSKAKFEVIP